MISILSRTAEGKVHWWIWVKSGQRHQIPHTHTHITEHIDSILRHLSISSHIRRQYAKVQAKARGGAYPQCSGTVDVHLSGQSPARHIKTALVPSAVNKLLL